MTKSEKTRQFIIERSAAIINKKGIAGTAISDLMEATKLAKGGIYGNFNSKEEICAEVFQYLSDRISSGLDMATAGKRTAREKLHAMLDHYNSQPVSGETGGCPFLNFGTEADDTNPELRALVAKAIRKTQQRFANVIEEGKAAGELKRSTDAALFAMKMFVMIEGAIFTSRVMNNKATLKTVVDLLKNEIDAL